MKKKIALISVIMICLAISVSGTLAYFTAEERAHNVITSGGISIELIEKTKDGSGALVDFPANGIGGVMPGAEVSKIVSVKNTGTSEAWVRIKVEQSIEDASGNALPLTLTVSGSSVPVITADVDPRVWILGSDGYYYYTKPVAAQGVTDTLFETVRFAHQTDNTYQECTANIVVTAQAVQTANNPIPAGGSVADVKGWPKEGSN